MSRVLDVKLGLFASSEYVASLPARPGLKHLDFIMWSDELAHIAMARWMREHAHKPPALTTNCFLTMRAAALRGLGVVLFPDLQARLAKLVPVPIRVAGLPAAPTYLVVHRALRRVPRVAAVVELLLEAMAGIRDQNPPGWLLLPAP